MITTLSAQALELQQVALLSMDDFSDDYFDSDDEDGLVVEASILDVVQLINDESEAQYALALHSSEYEGLDYAMIPPHLLNPSAGLRFNDRIRVRLFWEEYPVVAGISYENEPTNPNALIADKITASCWTCSSPLFGKEVQGCPSDECARFREVVECSQILDLQVLTPELIAALMLSKKVKTPEDLLNLTEDIIKNQRLSTSLVRTADGTRKFVRTYVAPELISLLDDDLNRIRFATF